MKMLTCFDKFDGISSFFTDNAVWQDHSGWKNPDERITLLQEHLNIPIKKVQYVNQKHTGNVVIISEETTDDRSCDEDEYDAMVTADPGVLLCIRTSDCIPLFLYEPRKHIAAISHCGWRGICKGTVTNTVNVMTEQFGACPEYMAAAIGPGICGKCYEVGSELIEPFLARFSHDEIRALFTPRQKGKYLLDLKKAVAFELLRAGVQAGNIHDTGICSYESENYSSYRRSGRCETYKQTLSGIILR